MKSYWIWHYGEYEIYHSMLVHLRRQEYGVDYPAMWEITSPYVSVEFKKEFTSNVDGEITVYSTGTGYVEIDSKRFRTGQRIAVPAGDHCIFVRVAKTSGLPAIFVESDICASDETWGSKPLSGDYIPVGTNRYYDDVSKNPEVFPFVYENKLPVRTEFADEGIIYDFGTELFGYLNIGNARPEAELGVFYGESREEALDTENSIIFEIIGGKAEYRLRQRAFRYVYIKGDDLKSLKIDMDFEYLPLEKKCSFRCDNELFNTIYEKCIYTFHLNCREGFLDGIKRDRWIWSGDAYQSAKINAYLFADMEIDERTAIELIGREPVNQHLNTIIDYSFLWMIGLYEHYMTYGNKGFLKRIYPLAQRLMEYCETKIDENGFIVGRKGDWTFIDWSVDWTGIDKSRPVCAEQILFSVAYLYMKLMGDIVGIDTDYAEKSVALKKKINEFFWDDELGGFVDYCENGERKIQRHANIFAVMYDFATLEQTQRIACDVLNNDSIPPITTPYFEGYELDVLCKLGDFEAVENMIESYWGGMVKLGADTIWEEYNPQLTDAEHYEMYDSKYGKSLCHAWGAGPVYLFGRYYLGVYPTSPGYGTFNVEPHLGGLNEISGTVHINGGNVSVSIDNDKITVLADKPGGTLIWDDEEYDLKQNEELNIKRK